MMAAAARDAPGDGVESAHHHDKRIGDAERAFAFWPVILLGTAAVALGLAVQATTYLNHDLAWILYSTRRLLAGAEFGRQVLAVNPPLAWALAAPAVALADWAGIDPAAVWRGLVAVATLASLGWMAALARRVPAIAPGAGVALPLAAVFAFFLACYRDFGQREYLALGLALPYLTLVAARLSGTRPGLREALLAGAVAAVGLALKPYFLAVPVVVELVAMAVARRPGFALRAEVGAGAAVVAAYAASLPVLVPAYLFDVIPMVSRIYWGFQVPMATVLGHAGFSLAALTAAAILLRWLRPAPLAAVLLAAAAGFAISYLIQGKGYSYHEFPLRALAVMVLTLLVAAAAARRQALAPLALAITVLAVTLIDDTRRAAGWYRLASRLDLAPAATRLRYDDPRTTDEVIAIVNRLPATRSFLALATHPFPGFPTALYVAADWASRTNSRFFLPAIAKLRARGAKPDDPTRVFAETRARQMVLTDLGRRPALVLVDAGAWQHGIGARPFDILDFYREDPAFRRAWARYRERPPIQTLRVFERIEGEP